jgi:SAM-dependent methyltransferase
MSNNKRPRPGAAGENSIGTNAEHCQGSPVLSTARIPSRLVRDRFAALREWARLLRPGGRLLSADPAAPAGAVAKDEPDARTATGFCLIMPPGLNERAIAAAGLAPLASEDRSDPAAEIAGRWHDARARHRAELEPQEGAEAFAQRQRYFATVQALAAGRRLSQVVYVGESRWGRRGRGTKSRGGAERSQPPLVEKRPHRFALS